MSVERSEGAHKNGRCGSPARKVRRGMLLLLADRRGNLSTVAAFMILPVMMFIGIAVDLSLAYNKRFRAQDAADSTVLTLVKEVGVEDNSKLKARAQKLMKANLPAGQAFTINDLEISRTPAKVSIDATLSYKTAFLRLAHIPSIDVDVTSEAVSDGSTLEIALVLDNSGSMAGSRIDALKQASRDFTERLFGSASAADAISISVVPFAGMVNIGSQHRGATWLDMKALNTEFQEMGLAPGVNRWDLYDGLKNVTWRGCVEARKHPFDVDDIPANVVNHNTLWVPSFAPDEPSGSANNYLNDSSHSHGWGWGWGRPSQPADPMAKYKDAYADIRSTSGTTSGPNFLCDSDPITPLTTDKSRILSAINAMSAYGGTNMHLGIMWGWRTLSPAQPFTEGRPYTKTDNAKIIVLMSDGANFANSNYYSAYNYSKYGRLGTTSTNSSTLVSHMNERTLEACTNAKEAGIKVITIAFAIDDSAARNVLSSCASNTSLAYTVNSSSELVAKFEEIAKGLQKMRIAY